MKKTKLTALCLLVFIGATLLSACGNKGPLYTSSQDDAQTTTQQSANKTQ